MAEFCLPSAIAVATSRSRSVSEADRVNYDADRAYLQLTILPGVWTTSWLHPEVQK